jgi:hypothetical protein
MRIRSPVGKAMSPENRIIVPGVPFTVFRPPRKNLKDILRFDLFELRECASYMFLEVPS